MVGGRR